LKHRSLGNFGALLPGDLACPVFFVGGNHEPYVALDDATGPYPYPWGDTGDVFYLGRVGTTNLGELQVAWISGIYSADADPALRVNSPRMRTYFAQDELCQLESAMEAVGGVDVLLTHEWPSGLYQDRGSQALRNLVERLAPKLHLCGHLHRSLEATIGRTHVEALTAVPAVTRNQHRHRFGWWRLYEKHSDGTITCLRVGS